MIEPTKVHPAVARANARAMDVAVKVAAQNRLLAAIADKRIVDSAIDRAAAQIAEAFSR